MKYLSIALVLVVAVLLLAVYTLLPYYQLLKQFNLNAECVTTNEGTFVDDKPVPKSVTVTCIHNF